MGGDYSKKINKKAHTRILHRAGSRVDAVLADAGEKLGLLGGHGPLDAAAGEAVEEGGAEDGPREPAEPGAGHRQQAQAEDRVHRDAAQQPLGVLVHEQHRARPGARHRRHRAARQLDPAPGLAQPEERIPVKRRLLL